MSDDVSEVLTEEEVEEVGVVVNIEVVSGVSTQIGRKSVKRYIFIGGFLAHEIGIKWSSRCTYITTWTCVISIGVMDS